MSCEDHIPEPEPDDDHFVHMHIDFSEVDMEGDPDDDSPTMGIVHMHVHGVPPNMFVETLLMLAVSVTADAMQNGEGPFDLIPEGVQRDHIVQQVARSFLAQKIQTTGSSGIMVHAPIVPNDASSLFTDEP